MKKHILTTALSLGTIFCFAQSTVEDVPANKIKPAYDAIAVKEKNEKEQAIQAAKTKMAQQQNVVNTSGSSLDNKAAKAVPAATTQVETKGSSVEAIKPKDNN